MIFIATLTELLWEPKMSVSLLKEHYFQWFATCHFGNFTSNEIIMRGSFCLGNSITILVLIFLYIVVDIKIRFILFINTIRRNCSRLSSLNYLINGLFEFEITNFPHHNNNFVDKHIKFDFNIHSVISNKTLCF